MNRKAETKYVAQNSPFSAVYGDVYPGGGPVQLYTCLPDVPQGDESINRQGLKISPSRHRTDLRFVFNDDPQITTSGAPAPASQAGWDITVHIWYGFCKRYKATGDVQANASQLVAEMLDIGTGATSRFTGLLTDEFFETNKEVLTVKHKKVRMYKNAGLANVCDITAPALSTPMSEAKRVSLSWKPPKTLGYKAELINQPDNYAPFLIVGYVHNDASQASDITHSDPTTDPTKVSAIKMAMSHKLWFKDI